MSELGGLVAVVTGGASGIGRATARLFASRGAAVAALDVAPQAGEDGILELRADVRDQASVERAVERVVDELGGVDLLVNNAGVGAVGTVLDGDEDEWRRVLDVNLMGTVRVTRAAMPHLCESSAAAIVNTSSALAVVGVPQRACYGASKGAIQALTFAMAADALADGIRVNCVMPGTVGTAWVDRLIESADDPAAARSALEARQPLGRLATPEEVAEAIAYLVSPRSTFVTGTSLSVDGGLLGMRLPAGPR